MRRNLVIVFLAAASLLIAGTAHAAWVNKSDPNDEQTPIDIKRMSLKVPGGTPFGGGNPILCKVTYWGNVEKEQVRNFRCLFDIKGSTLIDAFADVEWNGTEFTAEWYKYRNGVPEQTSTNLRVFHSAQSDSTTVKVPRKKLRGRDSHLRWAGYTWSNQPPCPDSGFGCADEAPNNGGSWKFEYR